MVKIRKEEAGSDSFGNVWGPGEVIDVPDWQGEQLLAIGGAGFSRARKEEADARKADARKADADRNTDGTDQGDAPGQRPATTGDGQQDGRDYHEPHNSEPVNADSPVNAGPVKPVRRPAKPKVSE